MKKYKYILLINILFTILLPQYGKNIVQYEDFDWSYIQSRHFDIYYDVDGLTHANFVAKEAELAYDHISTHLNWKLKHRVSIIIYNSHNDFQQTNVVDSYPISMRQRFLFQRRGFDHPAWRGSAHPEPFGVDPLFLILQKMERPRG